jgi:hypothetical protein
MRALAFLVLVSLVPATTAHALWGEKSRACPRWVDRLARLEQAGNLDSTPLRKLRNRIADRCVAMNEIQVLGTHNSYHVQPRPALMSLYLSTIPALEAWQYTHPSLDVQLTNEGVRQFELDAWADPDGGLFARRGALALIGEDPNSGIPDLQLPGFKVFHIQDFDFESNCLTFKACLGTVKDWSDTHRGHLPLVILVEIKDDPLGTIAGVTPAVPVPIGPAELDALDDEIRSVFPRRQVITPDDVRRGRATLEEAVLDLGWPRLGAARGRVIFLMDNASRRALYLVGHPSLAGRMLFTNSLPGSADGAFVEINDSFDPDIPSTVAAGYLVRTRTDSDTVEARANDTGPRDAAIASGAQYVSTDYPEPDPQLGTPYYVAIPGGMTARCNPVNAPPGCRDGALERLH